MQIREIRSKINNEILHYSIFDIDSKNEETDRTHVVDNKEFIQLSILHMNNGQTFLPHKHIYKDFNDKMIAQESWVILKGKVKVLYYDTDDSLLEEVILNQHDVSITIKGGHNYVFLENDSVVLEYKTGPYFGQKLDKVHI